MFTVVKTMDQLLIFTEVVPPPASVYTIIITAGKTQKQFENSRFKTFNKFIYKVLI